jgi:hypothetical protein
MHAVAGDGLRIKDAMLRRYRRFFEAVRANHRRRIDHARINVLAGDVENAHARGRSQVFADADNFAVANDNRTVFNYRAGDSVDRAASEKKTIVLAMEHAGADE